LERCDMHPSTYAVAVPLALAEGSLGDTVSAQVRLDHAIEQLRQGDGGGVLLGIACETYARVAIMLRDAAMFQRWAAACESEFRIGSHHALLSRHEKLMEAARAAGLLGEPASLASEIGRTRDTLAPWTDSVSVLGHVRDPEQRAAQALGILCRVTNSRGGHLYVAGPLGSLVRMAQLGAAVPPPAADAKLSELVRDAGLAQTLSDVETSDDTWLATETGQYAALLLSHEGEQGRTVSGVALLLGRRGKAPQAPGRLLQAVSRALVEHDETLASRAQSLTPRVDGNRR
jgi:hypothetical protein